MTHDERIRKTMSVTLFQEEIEELRKKIAFMNYQKPEQQCSFSEYVRTLILNHLEETGESSPI